MKRIVIIGGGVIGLCTALYCRRAGFDVTVVERGGPDHDSCSLGNAGMIVPSHFVPLAAPGMVSYGLKTMWNPESPFHIKPRMNADLIDWGMKFIRSASSEHVDASAPLLRDLHLLSRAEFVALAESLERPFGLVEKGLLMLCRESSTLHEESALAKRAVGIECAGGGAHAGGSRGSSIPVFGWMSRERSISRRTRTSRLGSSSGR